VTFRRPPARCSRKSSANRSSVETYTSALYSSATRSVKRRSRILTDREQYPRSMLSDRPQPGCVSPGEHDGIHSSAFVSADKSFLIVRNLYGHPF